MNEKPEKVCNRCQCGNAGQKKHSCPLAEVLEYENSTKCNCCKKCENKCQDES